MKFENILGSIKERSAQRIKDLAVLSSDARLLGAIHDCAWQCISALRDGHKLILFGNGGSAAQAQHWAAELVGTFKKKDRPALPAIALGTDTATLTALVNDMGIGSMFSRHLAALAQPGDVAIGISTSGHSLNVLNALELGFNLGCHSWLLTGLAPSTLEPDSWALLTCPGADVAAIQESHLFVAHAICEAIDDNVG